MAFVYLYVYMQSSTWFHYHKICGVRTVMIRRQHLLLRHYPIAKIMPQHFPKPLLRSAHSSIPTARGFYMRREVFGIREGWDEEDGIDGS
jgi:hypothetical protein